MSVINGTFSIMLTIVMTPRKVVSRDCLMGKVVL